MFRMLSPMDMFVMVVSATATWITALLLYNLYLHPLKSFPGPLFGRATRLYSAYIRATGASEQKVLELHQRYGSVVRIAPDELSFNGGTSWEDIYGIKSKKDRLQKDPHFYMGAIAPNGEKNLGAANDEDHSRIRSVLAHGFSDRALYAQEPLLRGHVDRLVHHLRELQGDGTNVVRWMHHIAYDIIAHLCFGQDSRALDHDGWHPQAKIVFEGIREGVTLVEILRFLPFKLTILNTLVKLFGEARRKNFEASVAKANARLESGRTDNVDFSKHMSQSEQPLDTHPDQVLPVSYILRAEGSSKKLTSSELSANICLLIDAGSETTATMLSGCFFNLASNKPCLQKLTHLLRSEFGTSDQMTIRSLARISFLTDVLQESLRLYPSLPATLPRVTPADGATIDGLYVPPNIKVGVNQYAAYSSPANFTDPSSFIPDRWNKDHKRFETDHRQVLQPFSIGSRGCLGKNLAWAEMRLIVAVVLWNFDIELAPESADWIKSQKTWFIWHKPELLLRFKFREEAQKL